MIAGEEPLAALLLEEAAAAGWDAATPEEARGRAAVPDRRLRRDRRGPAAAGRPAAAAVRRGAARRAGPGRDRRRASCSRCRCVDGAPAELTRGPSTSPAAAAAAERFFATLGRGAEWVGDAPGLVSGRILATLVNEACFALGEGVGSAADIDAGMELGLNHPRGPLAWGDLVGPGAVLETLLALGEEYREERYRPAPALVARRARRDRARRRRSTLGRVTRRTLPAALAALAALALPSTAAAAGPDGTAPAPARDAAGRASAAAADADPATWIVAARGDRAAGDRIARAHGARRIAGGAWEVARGRARPLAAALRAHGLLDYAEPNRIARPAQAPDPLSAQAAWRDFVVGPAVAPPVDAGEPADRARRHDRRHEPSGDRRLEHHHARRHPARGLPRHGDRDGRRPPPPTASGCSASGPARGRSTCRCRNGQQILCSDSSRAIARAVRRGAAVINMSYGSPTRCGTEAQQIAKAVKAGAIPVAASGNEGEKGNPLEFPASLPHVLTVAAIGPDDKPTSFSNNNAAIDLSAPGIGILTGVPAAFDPDGTADGFAAVSGTSFSAPMVSAAAAWIRAARPDLTPYQAAQVVRRGARDIGRRGYENATGFGALSLPGALAQQPPADDPLEPNDDVRHVDGRAFGALAAPLFNGGKPKTIAAEADVAEDPVDVYRVKVRAGHRLRATLTPASGDPDLYVFDSHARERVRQAAGPGRAVDAPARPRSRDRPQPRQPDDDVLRRRRLRQAQGPRAARRALHAARRLIASAARARATPTAPRRGRRCRRAPRAWGRAGCRAGTTRRRAPPGSRCRPR